MSDTPSSKPLSTAKSIFQSKTVWVQAITFLLSFFPLVRDWVTAHPTEFVSVLVAVNLLVRYFSQGRLTIFPSSEDDEGDSNPPGVVPIGILACMAAGLMGLSQSSCSSSEYPVTASAYVRDPESGAKAGLTLTPNKPASIFGRVPFLNDLGERIGWLEATMPIQKASSVELPPATIAASK